MAIYIPTSYRTTDPVSACPPCNGGQREPCPTPGFISGSCGNCHQQVLLAFFYLGQLRCWTMGDRTCNPNACCPIIDFNPWPDLRSGLWVSSVVVPIYLDCAVGGPQAATATVGFSGNGITLPKTTGASAICGTTQVATLTVFDDGSFAFA